MELIGYTITDAFKRMNLCGNKECSCYGDDTPDANPPGDNRCLMCGKTKVHWTTIPQSDLHPGLIECLATLKLIGG